MANGSFRLGPVKLKTAGLGAAGCVAFLFAVAVFYAVSVAFWSWILMLVLGAAGVDWSYTHCVFPWGLLMPFVLG